jgi:hypothetical protein
VLVQRENIERPGVTLLQGPRRGIDGPCLPALAALVDYDRRYVCLELGHVARHEGRHHGQHSDIGVVNCVRDSGGVWALVRIVECETSSTRTHGLRLAA